MDVEIITVIGKFAIVITLVILGAITEWKGQDSDGYFFWAFMAAIYFINF